MPARHDILCGALDFLWKPWGSIELWERPVTADLRAAGVTTMLVSDHPHLFETGGDAYDLAVLDQGLLVVLGDATGHGIAPALSVTQMQAMLRMAFRLGADLETAFLRRFPGRRRDLEGSRRPPRRRQHRASAGRDDREGRQGQARRR